MKENIYGEKTYGGLVNRIRDGVTLSERQKTKMLECGLTMEDFQNQKSLAEKLAIVNAARAQNEHRVVSLSPKTFSELIEALKPDDRFTGDNGELILISPNGNRLHIEMGHL